MFAKAAVVVLMAGAVIVPAVPAIAVSAKPAPIKFGVVGPGSTKSKVVTVTLDPGYQAGGESGGGINAPFSQSANTCVTGATGTCSLTEVFAPTGPGDFDTTLFVSECNGLCINLAIPIVARSGVFAAKVPTIKFGSVAPGTTKTKKITLKFDTGYQSGGQSGGGINTPFNTSGCTSGATVKCTLTETFAPTQIGVYNTTLYVSECNGPCINVAIPIQATSGVVTAKPAPVKFGSVAAGGTKVKKITLTFDPGWSSGGQSGGGINAPFNASGCSAGTMVKCIITETFAPSQVGIYDTTLYVSECNVVCVNMAVPITAKTGV
jgi:hypothetical protein